MATTARRAASSSPVVRKESRCNCRFGFFKPSAQFKIKRHRVWRLEALMAAISGNSLGIVTAHSILDQSTGILYPIADIVKGSSSPPNPVSKHHLIFPVARKYMDFVQTEMEPGDGDASPMPLPEVPESERLSRVLEILPGKLSAYLELGTKGNVMATSYIPEVVLVNHTTSLAPLILNSRKEDWYVPPNPIVISPNGGKATVSYYELSPTSATPRSSVYTQLGVELEGVPYLLTISQYVTLETPGDNTSRPVYPEMWIFIQ